MAPFFVFQVVCLFLWSLDDYWYYSVFTLMMLMVFEGVMCKQRQNNVLMMRSMRRPAHQILAYRHKKWTVTTSELLAPGDIISITADPAIPLDRNPGQPHQETITEEGKIVPCDILLVRGSCVVNEAMLTGESIPKMKECLDVNMSAVLDDNGNNTNIIKNNKWSRHILLGGTQLQQHTSSTNLSDPAASLIPPPPDRGCIGIVIRTGFATTQGELMRKILFATEGVAANTSETFVFIAALVCFAVVAAAVVLKDGLFDERRNKFRLVLHCIMIVTSVVPPELPMELSLAVTNSLAALSKQMIFCTEPFRIPLAGKLNVICFDKTGTLTKDEMNLKGVVGAQDIDIITGVPVVDTDEDEASKSHHQTSSEENSPVVTPVASSSSSGSSSKAGVTAPLPVQSLSPDMYSVDSTTELVQCIMGTCQDLVLKMNTQTQLPQTLGDPMELTAFQASGFSFVPVAADGSPVLPSAHTASKKITTVALVHAQQRISATVIQRYAFSSDLKRSSVIVELRRHHTQLHVTNNKDALVQYIFCKGAPEVLQQQGLLAPESLPDNFNQVCQYHMQAGKRVIALAYRRLSTTSSQHPQSMRQLATMPRAEAEQQLRFAGFLVFDSDLKADSKGVIKELHYAQQQVVMITGDSVFTAASVAKRLTIISNKKPTLMLTVVRTGDTVNSSTSNANTSSELEPSSTGKATGQLVWRKIETSSSSSTGSTKKKSSKKSGVSAETSDADAANASSGSLESDGKKAATKKTTKKASTLSLADFVAIVDEQARHVDDVDFELSSVETWTSTHSLCVTGPALDLIAQQSKHQFASMLKVMVPHIAIFARVSPQQKEKIVLAFNETGRFHTLMCGDGTNDVGALKAAHVGVSIINNPSLEKKVEGGLADENGGGNSGSSSSKKSANSVKDRAARALLELQEQEQDPSIVKLGDASIASPFTTKRTSVDSVLAIIRQGRCTLVTSIQVYKVLALNCLASAYMMSGLYLRGLKHGDMQMTVSGILIAACFFFLSQAKPLLDVSAHAPPASVFAPAVYFSILGQFAVHLVSMMVTVRLCDDALASSSEVYASLAVASAPDSRFTPNLINTTMFILMTLMQCNNFWVNYRGPPFMESLTSHVYFYRMLVATYAAMLIVVGGQFEPLNDFLQLVQLPSVGDFQAKFLAVLVGNAVCSFVVERGCRRLE